MANVPSKCQRPGPLGCFCYNVIAHYQHIAPGINHQWEEQPSVGPLPDSAPHPTPCPNDGVPPGPLSIAYKAVYSRCPVCGYIKVWP
jgi:hypothetical protein